MPSYRVTNAAGIEVLRFDYAGDHAGALLEAKRQLLRTVASPAEGGPQLFDLMLDADLMAEIEIRVEGVLAQRARGDV
jgi:hypothetical protein